MRTASRFFYAPSQIWTLTFDADNKTLSADITGKKITRADADGIVSKPAPPPLLVPWSVLEISLKPARVEVNSQKTLAESVGDGFPDEAWLIPTGFLPTEFPEFRYVSGPADKSLSPKAAWRKPVVLKHEDSGVELHVNCYRLRDKPAVKHVKGLGTPFLPLTEPDYQYEQLEFHNLRAAMATTESDSVIVFRRGDVLFKVEATGGKADVRRKLAVAAAEAIWNAQQAQ
jgi:hypothetical protein